MSFCRGCGRDSVHCSCGRSGGSVGVSVYSSNEMFSVPMSVSYAPVSYVPMQSSFPLYSRSSCHSSNASIDSMRSTPQPSHGSVVLRPEHSVHMNDADLSYRRRLVDLTETETATLLEQYFGCHDRSAGVPSDAAGMNSDHLALIDETSLRRRRFRITGKDLALVEDINDLRELGFENVPTVKLRRVVQESKQWLRVLGGCLPADVAVFLSQREAPSSHTQHTQSAYASTMTATNTVIDSGGMILQHKHHQHSIPIRYDSYDQLSMQLPYSASSTNNPQPTAVPVIPIDHADTLDRDDSRRQLIAHGVYQSVHAKLLAEGFALCEIENPLDQYSIMQLTRQFVAPTTNAISFLIAAASNFTDTIEFASLISDCVLNNQSKLQMGLSLDDCQQLVRILLSFLANHTASVDIVSLLQSVKVLLTIHNHSCTLDTALCELLARLLLPSDTSAEVVTLTAQIITIISSLTPSKKSDRQFAVSRETVSQLSLQILLQMQHLVTQQALVEDCLQSVDSLLHHFDEQLIRTEDHDAEQFVSGLIEVMHRYKESNVICNRLYRLLSHSSTVFFAATSRTQSTFCEVTRDLFMSQYRTWNESVDAEAMLSALCDAVSRLLCSGQENAPVSIFSTVDFVNCLLALLRSILDSTSTTSTNVHVHVHTVIVLKALLESQVAETVRNTIHISGGEEVLLQWLQVSMRGNNVLIQTICDSLVSVWSQTPERIVNEWKVDLVISVEDVTTEQPMIIEGVRREAALMLFTQALKEHAMNIATRSHVVRALVILLASSTNALVSEHTAIVESCVSIMRHCVTANPIDWLSTFQWTWRLMLLQFELHQSNSINVMLDTKSYYLHSRRSAASSLTAEYLDTLFIVFGREDISRAMIVSILVGVYWIFVPSPTQLLVNDVAISMIHLLVSTLQQHKGDRDVVVLCLAILRCIGLDSITDERVPHKPRLRSRKRRRQSDSSAYSIDVDMNSVSCGKSESETPKAQVVSRCCDSKVAAGAVCDTTDKTIDSTARHQREDRRKHLLQLFDDLMFVYKSDECLFSLCASCLSSLGSELSYCPIEQYGLIETVCTAIKSIREVSALTMCCEFISKVASYHSAARFQCWQNGLWTSFIQWIIPNQLEHKSTVQIILRTMERMLNASSDQYLWTSIDVAAFFTIAVQFLDKCGANEDFVDPICVILVKVLRRCRATNHVFAECCCVKLGMIQQSLCDSIQVIIAKHGFDSDLCEHVKLAIKLSREIH